MFHVDKLPLDHDNIRDVSRDLTILASKNAKGNPTVLQTNARLLAIAMRLDSNNQEARKLNQKFVNKVFVVEPGGEEYLKAAVRISFLIKGLSKVEKYDEAHTLLSYIKDALKNITPNDPVIKAHKVMPQRWKNVVPTMASKAPVRPHQHKKQAQEEQAHESKMPDKKAPDPAIANRDQDENNTPKSDEGETSTSNKWHILASELSSPVFIVDRVRGKEIHKIQLCKFKVSIKPRSNSDEKLEFHMSPDMEDDRADKLAERIQHFLKRKWKQYPSLEVKVKTSGKCSRRYYDRNLLPLLMQLNASLSNTTINPDVVVVGALHGESIRRDDLFWRQLKAIRAQKALKQTLLCPASTEGDLAQLVALEEADFFVRNEVILVENLDQAIKFSSELKDEKLKTAHEEFVKIRDLIGTRSVGSFSVNKKIRAKLELILQLNPNHMSAKMILLRGETKRATKLASFFVAEEFKPIVKNQKYVAEKEDPERLSEDDLKLRSERIDEAVKAMSRYIDSEDREFREALENMADELNNMSRSLGKEDSDYHKRSLRVSYERFIKHYEAALDYIKKVQSDDE